jgi:NAD(P)-dependent dehydrogenase (short-subunit alcohol dehydrogenase family)
VTGAGSGIGRASAIRASAMGLRVAAWDIDSESVNDTVRTITETGGVATAFVADVSVARDVERAFDATREALGQPLYLLNNAGPSSSAQLDFDTAMTMCVGSMRRMTEKWAAPGLPEGAAVVVMSSVAGNRVGVASDWYTAAKAALMGYVRHLASYRAGEMRANAVAPGMTDTPRLASFAASETGARVLARIPLKRMATPDEVACASLFLLSPAASYINGVLLPVDGGWTITQ